MILICPFCQTRYEIGDDRQPTESLRVRCRRCQETFFAGAENRNPNSSGNGGKSPATGPIVVVAAESGAFRNLLCGVLKKSGVAVKVTADGEQALEWVRKIKPNALFAAVFLRRMLGITLSERIRAVPELEATRIALIGHPLDRDRPAPDLELLFGAHYYLEETMGPEELFLRTGNVLGIVPPREEEDRDEADDDTAADVTAERPAQPDLAPIDGADGDPESARPEAPDSVIPDDTTEEIRRLGRIAASDLYLYYPSEVITAVKTDHLEDIFRDDLEKGRRMIEERFPAVPTAVEIFFLALKESLAKTADQTVS